MNHLVRRRREGWSPMRELDRLRHEIDMLFESPLGFMPQTEVFGGWAPTVDLYEDKDRFTVQCELPGMKKEDIQITLEGNTLAISGERKQEQEHESAEAYRSERFFGRFQRNITLPQAVDPNKIEAHYKDGILTITLPKTEEAKRKQIEIKTT